MDTLKSYFNKMKILPGHGNKSWTFRRKGSLGKQGKGKKYTRSKSQNDAQFESQHNSNSTSEDKENTLYSKTGTLLARDGTNRETIRSPPAKPPRKDHIFIVDFHIGTKDNFGLVVGNVTDNLQGIDHLDNMSRDDLNDSFDEMAYRTISPIKVVAITEGSLVYREGQIQVHDEIMEVNGRPVQGETIQAIR
ncbi:hypothetical protein DPMN_116450 [Dreissena polymorpha]|uniref:PDZ domain-containing protein n=2 Tax=Dreissena polymorpha TaxID=45954 RepID=A0A9D4KNZ3_DREPO|nr:hypothetical protein DPMN_116450 [Dreissena polymorpha]